MPGGAWSSSWPEPSPGVRILDNGWFRKSYRRNLVDMHIEEWDERFLSRFDPERYVRLLKSAHVQSAMVYANSHVGCCYWPTRTGHMHRGIKGQDILGSVISLCHRSGMDVIVYYSLIFNNWAYEAHPQWRIIDANGFGSREKERPIERRARRYGVCCPNNAEYRAFEEAQIRELCEGYEFEGMFFDMNFWPTVCYCGACRKRFAAEAGSGIPTVIDWEDPKWRLFQGKREEWLAEHAVFTRAAAKRWSPGLSVEHNSSGFTAPWHVGTTARLPEANDYIGGDLYGGFTEQSFICKLYSSITPHQPFEYMTSRCFPDILDHTTMKSPELLELQAMLTHAHGGAFLCIDAINPDGTMEQGVYDLMAGVFSKSESHEKYFGGRLCADVGVYFSPDSKMDFSDNGVSVAEYCRASASKVPHLAAAVGAARILKGNHIPFGVISRNSLTRLSEHSVVVLPDALSLRKEEIGAFGKYVADGGNLYLSGRSVVFFPAMCNVEYEGVLPERVSYVSPCKGAADFLFSMDLQAPLSIQGCLVKACALSRAEVQATITRACTHPSDPDQFASIHSDPPGDPTEYPAIISRPFGKGRLIWSAASLESQEKGPHDKLFVRIIQSLATRPFRFDALAPAAIEIIVMHQPDRSRFVVSAVNEQELLPPVPACGIKVILRMPEMKPVRVLRLPEEDELSFEWADGAISFTAPTVVLFQMMSVEYEPAPARANPTEEVLQ